MLLEEKEVLFLDKVEDEEKAYKWVEAANSYEQIVKTLLDKNMIKECGEIYKKLGYAYRRAAEIIETAEEYIEQNEYAIKAYTEAANFFNKIEIKSEELECKAEIHYIRGFFTDTAKKAKDYFSKSYDLFIESSEFYSKDDGQEKIARVYSRAAMALTTLILYCTDSKEIEEIFQKGKDISDKAWMLSKDNGNLQSLAESLFANLLIIIFVIFFMLPFKEDDHWKKYVRKFLLRCDESIMLAEGCNDYFTLGLIYFSAGFIYSAFGNHFVEDDIEQREYFNKGLFLLENGLEFARKSKEKKLIVLCLFWLNLWAFIIGRLNYLQKRIIHDFHEIVNLGKIYSGVYCIWHFFANFLPAFYYANFAQRSFITPTKRETFAKKGIEYTKESLKKLVYGPFYVWAYQMLTWSYSQLAIITTKKDEKNKHAQEMLQYAKKAENIGEKYKGGNAAASAFSSLYKAYKTNADIAKNKEEKIRMLSKAVEVAKKYIKHAVESRTGNIVGKVRLGLLYEEIGIFTGEIEPLIQAKDLYLNITQECLDRGYNSFAAGTYEYIARLEDRLGNHTASAKNYEKAREIYAESLKTIEYKILKKRVKKKINYTNAWNCIESAKAYHRSENHLKAKELYEKASEILGKRHVYKYEAPYYNAWALLEEAEQFSKQEMQEKAIEKYESTKIAFEKSIKSLEKVSKKSKEMQETERTDKLESVAKLRIEYCSARINLEEGRILGKQGEHLLAAEKFGSAASQFRSICTVFKIEREKRELEAIYYLCRAWESMELAEKYEEPVRFAEAANLFVQASNLFTETKLKLLASGNSAFCQALEYGCKFDESIETQVKEQLYPKVKSMLRKAASSYDKGGFESGADWALAMSIYFDAAWHLIKADEILDIDERGKLLGIGIRYLRSAAELFSKAGYDNKEKEIQNRLNRLEKEEKILFSALNTVEIPNISSSTRGIVAPTCPIEISESPRLSEINQIEAESRKVLGKPKHSYKDRLRGFRRGAKKNIFLCYSTIDSDYFQIPNIVEDLKEYPNIDNIFFWEADSKENIVAYMEKTLRKCNTFVLFCSENSLKSESVKGEWQSAYQMRKRGLMKIIPVYEDEDFIPILLMPMLNVKFTKDNFNEFIDKLYNEILR